jgi:hypothetical protein
VHLKIYHRSDLMLTAAEVVVPGKVPQMLQTGPATVDTQLTALFGRDHYGQLSVCEAQEIG